MGKFVGPVLKILRASEHGKKLSSLIDAFLDSHPYEVLKDCDADTGEWLVRVRVARPPAPIIGIVAGELAHTLRSALDYAIGELIAANTGAPPPVDQNFEFPIFFDSSKYAKAVWKNVGLSAAVLADLEAMQPYGTANQKRGRLLWQLHRLDIEDKHRQLAVAGGGMATTSISHTGKAGAAAFSVDAAQPLRHFPLQDGAVVFRFRSAEGPESKVEINLEAWVGLKNPPEVAGEPIATLLGAIFHEVEACLAELERRLP